MSEHSWGLFEAFGVELEYMIVSRDTLSVAPLTDQLLHDVAGEFTSEIEMGPLCWSNELALHVVELKTNGPVTTLDGVAQRFDEHVRQINRRLTRFNAQLMPSAMHPWMDPLRELQLWPHEYNAVYDAFHRIFDCRGHGWANLQSVHINLPFADDDQFGRLHAAIRLLLPILPALAASSPVVDRTVTGIADNRLEVYRHNADRIPSVAGLVVPEAVYTPADYDREIFQVMYRDIAPLDPHGVLQHEWLNARGAIARFDRNTIEIRVLDIQECPDVDLAICQVCVSVLQACVTERWTTFDQQAAMPTAALATVFDSCVRNAERAAILDDQYLSMFGCVDRPTTAGQLWQHICRQLQLSSAPIEAILSAGTLSTRIVRALACDTTPGQMVPHEQLEIVYRKLCHCLATGTMFDAAT
ncbi:MAG: glutamate-cysteine ligase family protein [Pirellulaceae bacterium]|nr:hypothetical protein [Planctomycetales bacterium]